MRDSTDVKLDINLIDHIRRDLGQPKHEDGKQAQWLCPFHTDKDTPSLTVWQDHFHCFGCGAHGDVFDWEMKRTGCDFRAAYQAITGEEKHMANRPRTRTVAEPAIMVKQPPPAEWQDRAALVIRDCLVELWETDKGARGRRWLAARGITEETMTKRWLGFNDTKREIHGHYVERGIIIPHLHENDAETVWGIKVRKSDTDDGPKYIHVTGSIPYLYGVETLKGHDKAFVCEGEFDAMLLYQFVGDLAGVITFGAATNHDVDTWLQHLAPIKRLYIATDADEAGEKAWEFWKGRTKRARRCVPPMGAKDITDAWKLRCDIREWARGEMLS